MATIALVTRQMARLQSPSDKNNGHFNPTTFFENPF